MAACGRICFIKIARSATTFRSQLPAPSSRLPAISRLPQNPSKKKPRLPSLFPITEKPSPQTPPKAQQEKTRANFSLLTANC